MAKYSLTTMLAISSTLAKTDIAKGPTEATSQRHGGPAEHVLWLRTRTGQLPSTPGSRVVWNGRRVGGSTSQSPAGDLLAPSRISNLAIAKARKAPVPRPTMPMWSCSVSVRRAMSSRAHSSASRSCSSSAIVSSTRTGPSDGTESPGTCQLWLRCASLYSTASIVRRPRPASANTSGPSVETRWYMRALLSWSGSPCDL
mmetsp:Transcript_72056/g.185876  ORF Transcript_72056/g.185876 Transcript_72056/m.185876 type:complete len:200 (+) Transcript_72056:1865-2464(+)